MIIPKLILITGVPGTGKTYIGNFLERNNGFIHYDFEQGDMLKKISSESVKFINEILEQKKDIIITWGFVPNEDQILIVNKLKENGFKLIWFDGNRKAALIEFNKRGNVPESLFHIQLDRINKSNVIKLINPTIINTFNDKGKFISPDNILLEIFKQ